MKRFILYTIIVIFALIIISATILILGNPDFSEELPQRLALYHNTGNITITIDGEQIDLEGLIITSGLFYISSESEKVATIKNNKFKIRDGSYGENMFRFTVPAKEYGDVTVEFGHFNTNWWHEVHYDIELNLVTNADGSLNADISQTVSYGGKKKFTHTNTHTLDSKNNITTIYVG